MPAAWKLPATWVAFLGNPSVSLLIGTLVATYVFGTRRGLGGAPLLAIVERALFPIASVLFIVGAGGGFGRVLDQSGIGGGDHRRGLVVGSCRRSSSGGWLPRPAGRRRIRHGSRHPGGGHPRAAPWPPPRRPTVNCWWSRSAPARSSPCHVNDGGFWLVKEYFGLDGPKTLEDVDDHGVDGLRVALGFVLGLNLVL